MFRTRNLTLGVISMIIVGMGVFYACKKDNPNYLLEESNNKNHKRHKSMITKEDFNWVSESFVQAFEITLNEFGFGEETNPNICGEMMASIVQSAVVSYGYSDIYIMDVEKIQRLMEEYGEEIYHQEVEYMTQMHQIFFHHSHENIICEIDNLLDEIVFSSMPDESKMRLCIYGKSFIGLNNISSEISLKIENGEIIIIEGEEDEEDEGGPCYANRESYNNQNANSRVERQMLSCLEYELDGVFGDDGNWVKVAGFIAGGGGAGSFAWMVGSCTWEIFRGRWAHVQ